MRRPISATRGVSLAPGTMNGFLEPLPSACPPTSAFEPTGLTVYRLAVSSPPSLTDFASHVALGIALPTTVDECRARSCSVFDSLEKLEGLRRLPRLRAHRVALQVLLDESAGVVLPSGSGHIDWWLYRGFDPCERSQVVREY